jgi:hypothetical protein
VITAEELTRTNPVRDGEVLPMQTREFAIATFKKLPKRAKPTEAELVAARAARAAAGAEDDDNPDNEGADEDRFEIAISSEFPVQRWFGKEILDHTPEAVDLSRAKSGLAFLDSHDSKSIVGVVNDVKLDKKDKVLRGVVQFSRNPKAQEVKRDVVDGIRKYISVGYGVNEYTLDKSSKDEGDTYRATSWTPLETSSVAVPADPSVGHNRKAGERGFPVKVLNPSAERSAEQTTEAIVMAETDHAQVLIDSRKTAGEIVKLGKRHGIDQERVATWISEGRTLDAVSALVLEEVASRSAKPNTTPGAAETREQLELTEKEQRE